MKRKIILGVALTLIVATFCTVFLTGCWDEQPNDKATVLATSDKEVFVRESLKLKAGESKDIYLQGHEVGKYLLDINGSNAVAVRFYEIDNDSAKLIKPVGYKATGAFLLEISKDADKIMQGCGEIVGYQQYRITLTAKADTTVRIVWGQLNAKTLRVIK